MSKRTLISELRKELQTVNDNIDRAILRGISYKKEARRHRELLTLLHRTQEEVALVRVSWKAFFGQRAYTSPARRALLGGASRRVLTV